MPRIGSFWEKYPEVDLALHHTIKRAQLCGWRDRYLDLLGDGNFSQSGIDAAGERRFNPGM
ncbi:hypothetical protein ACFS07_19660 [Undibacterium arcticum]